MRPHKEGASDETGDGEEEFPSSEEEEKPADTAEETPTEEKPVEDETPKADDLPDDNAKDEVHEALVARVAALEEMLQKILERFDNQDFGGVRANSTEKVEDDALSEDDRIMRNYYGTSYRR